MVRECGLGAKVARRIERARHYSNNVKRRPLGRMIALRK